MQMVDVEHIKALVAQVSGDSEPCRAGEDWRDWRFGVEAGGAPARAELARIGAPAVPYLIERIDDNYVRWVLRDMGDAAVMPLIASLDDPQRRGNALGVLAETKSKLPVIDETLLRLATSAQEEPAAHLSAALALAARRHPRALELLVALLDSIAKDARVTRERAAHTDMCVLLNALGSYGDARAVPQIVPYLEWEDDPADKAWAVTVRSRAAHALGLIGDARAVDPLMTRLERESQPESRLRMAEALAWLGDSRAIPLVERVAREMLNPPIITQPLEKLKRRVQSDSEEE
jgi:HEAT repeat protein